MQVVNELKEQLEHIKQQECNFRLSVENIASTRVHTLEQLEALSQDYTYRVRQMDLKLDAIKHENEALIKQNSVLKSDIESYQARLIEKDKLIAMLVTQKDVSMRDTSRILDESRTEVNEQARYKIQNGHTLKEMRSPANPRLQMSTGNSEEKEGKEAKKGLEFVKKSFEVPNPPKKVQSSQPLSNPLPKPSLPKVPPVKGNLRQILSSVPSPIIHPPRKSQTSLREDQGKQSPQKLEGEDSFSKDIDEKDQQDQESKKVSQVNNFYSPFRPNEDKSVTDEPDGELEGGRKEESNADFLSHFPPNSNIQIENPTISSKDFFSKLSRNGSNLGLEIEESDISHADSMISNEPGFFQTESREAIAPVPIRMAKKKAKRDKIKLVDPSAFA